MNERTTLGGIFSRYSPEANAEGQRRIYAKRPWSLEVQQLDGTWIRVNIGTTRASFFPTAVNAFWDLPRRIFHRADIVETIAAGVSYE